MSIKIGFYICHCGINIAYRVRVEEVAAFVGKLKDVVVARDYKFMCSDPGQEMIEKDIKEYGLNRVVVASCSPRLHEKTFQGACQRAGLNPYMFQMASVREQVSWVTTDEEEATRKAKTLVTAAINRVKFHHSLETREVSVHPDVLVVGGGIAGMQAALDIGNAGHTVYLVERQPTLGGHMLQFDKTFPTLDCAACIGTPKMVEVAQNPNIELMTYSEVLEVSGYVGNYNIKIRRKPRFVDIQKCTGCGDCGAAALYDTEKPPVEADGELWIDRIQIDETRCIQCGDCIGACIQENPEKNAMSSIVDQRFQAVQSGQVIEYPAPLQRILRMSSEEQIAFWKEQFRKCIKCYGCIDVCPVSIEDFEELNVSKWVPEGQVPPPYPLFHLIRAYRVWDTCVGCGECERTCPAHIPLKMVQDLIRYIPPERVFEIMPGLPKEAREEIFAFVKSREASIRRARYAV